MPNHQLQSASVCAACGREAVGCVSLCCGSEVWTPNRYERQQIAPRHFYYSDPLEAIHNAAIEAPCFLSVLLIDQAYGGPEEGGWWYDCAERLETHYAATPRALSHILERIEAEYSNEGRRPISSVLSDGRFALVVGDVIPPQYQPERTPHYE